MLRTVILGEKDLIPIRTRVRLKDEECFTEEMVGSENLKGSTFDPRREWGSSHVLQEVEASGTWANIPLCASPTPMGNRCDLKQLLMQGVSSYTNILSFFSSKASANYGSLERNG
jgi:hypothetical protein